MANVPPSLHKIVSRLVKHYGKRKAPITTDPFELVLLENVAYLVSEERREDAFTALREHCGTKPHEILAASNENILKVTRLGGMHPEQRVHRLKEIALIAMNDFAGDLRQSLTVVSLTKAIQALRKFPSIGEPSAEKILLFAGVYPVLGLESNGLRVLLRLGFGEEKKNYTASYKSVQEAIKPDLKEDFAWLIDAHSLLRQHGKELCKTNNPKCDECPISSDCAWLQNRERSDRIK
jgi:endonuclease-3